MAGKVIVKDRGLERIFKESRSSGNQSVSIGVHGDDADARQDEGDFGSPLNNVQIAAILEYGAPGNTYMGRPAPIPERPALRGAFDKNKKKYEKFLGQEWGKVLDGKSTIRKALGTMGEIAVADVVNLINEGIPPPNSPVTIELKGSSKPWIDTGQLKAAIKWVIGRPRK